MNQKDREEFEKNLRDEFDGKTADEIKVAVYNRSRKIDQCNLGIRALQAEAVTVQNEIVFMNRLIDEKETVESEEQTGGNN